MTSNPPPLIPKSTTAPVSDEVTAWIFFFIFIHFSIYNPNTSFTPTFSSSSPLLPLATACLPSLPDLVATGQGSRGDGVLYRVLSLGSGDEVLWCGVDLDLGLAHESGGGLMWCGFWWLEFRSKEAILSKRGCCCGGEERVRVTLLLQIRGQNREPFSTHTLWLLYFVNILLLGLNLGLFWKSLGFFWKKSGCGCLGLGLFWKSLGLIYFVSLVCNAWVLVIMLWWWCGMWGAGK